VNKGRLEAFSDGVIAILITIMVLELRAPQGADLASLRAIAPTFAAYVLSFVVLGIYWNNHHHLVHAAERTTAGVLWANLHLLFWLSLVPFVTNWMGDHHVEPLPTSVYGVVMTLAAVAYTILQATIIRAQGEHSRLRRAIGSDLKGKLSLAMYSAAVGLAFLRPWFADALYVAVALMWLVPDRRIEATLHEVQAR
jgi:TMEM175 potassium channel family protein